MKLNALPFLILYYENKIFSMLKKEHPEAKKKHFL